MPLQLIYRPTKLEDVAGNKAVIESIKSIMGRKEDFPLIFVLRTVRMWKNYSCKDHYQKSLE